MYTGFKQFAKLMFTTMFKSVVMLTSANNLPNERMAYIIPKEALQGADGMSRRPTLAAPSGVERRQ